MNYYKTSYHRNLPHYQPLDYSFFITFRLDGTLPISIINRIQSSKEIELRKIAKIRDNEARRIEYYNYQKKFFVEYDEILNKALYGPKWLGIKEIAQIVKSAIHFYDGKLYKLICYSIMPNHVHLVLIPISNVKLNSVLPKFLNDDQINIQNNSVAEQDEVPLYIISDILQKLKRYTAVESNKHLKRTGAFWSPESYDHVVRNIKELRRIVEYVLNNPVKAELAENIEKWMWNYYNPVYIC